APYEFHRRRINEETELRRVIERVLSRHLGRPCRVVCVAPEEVETLRKRGVNESSRHESADEAGAAGGRVEEEDAPDPRALSGDDLRRLEAAKAIFDAVELS
ncbi:MAG: DNA polymerase III subunit gamma/tau, partial [Thermomicrobium sp.]|nr:DNA polymerase III subunit gamma/tau [Thermomicrobium sp.]MDW8007301.1 DNA polymerase III subunit gamma/tau [Thermomicrobium sp.]